MTPKRTEGPRAAWWRNLGWRAGEVSQQQARQGASGRRWAGRAQDPVMGAGGWRLLEGDLRMRSSGDGWGMKDTPAWGSSLWLVVTFRGSKSGLRRGGAVCSGNGEKAAEVEH